MKKEILFETDQDFVTYGKARSSGLGIDMALALVKVNKAVKA